MARVQPLRSIKSSWTAAAATGALAQATVMTSHSASEMRTVGFVIYATSVALTVCDVCRSVKG